jgi:2'-5' RNA ligase
MGEPLRPAAQPPGPPPARHPARRLFIALWPAPGTKRALAAWLRGWSWPAHAALVAPERLHLTLHFLGSVPESRLQRLRDAMAAPALDLAPCELRFDRVERWPHGLVVLGAQQLPEPLLALHARLADALRALQLPVEARRFRPHVTLARKAEGAEAPPDAPDIRWPVAGYALVQSADGYRTLQQYGPTSGTR